MAKRAKQIDRLKARIIRGIVECEDRSVDRAYSARLRRLRADIQERPIASRARLDELAERVDELKPMMGKGQASVIELYLSRLDALAKALYTEQDKRGFRMALFSKVKAVFTKSKEAPQDAMLRQREQDAEQKIFTLEKKIAEMCAERQSLMEQVAGKVSECAALPPDSAEYRITRQQALLLRPRIVSIEQQINMHAKLLESNARYHAMLEAGRTTLEIRSLMPDPAEADMLMRLIVDETQDIAGDTQAFGESVSEHGAKIEMAVSPAMLDESDAFDRMVKETKQQEAAQSPAVAEAGDNHNAQSAVDDDRMLKGELE